MTATVIITCDSLRNPDCGAEFQMHGNSRVIANELATAAGWMKLPNGLHYCPRHAEKYQNLQRQHGAGL